ncbi:MAG: hypothetical protein OEL83_01645 [Desulforhopalus sp.]|nr:hypothetical protein [Desulforhopalus sp.]
MKIQCPHCGVKGSADDSYLGQKVKCPKCQGVFAVLSDVVEEAKIDLPPVVAPPDEPSEDDVSSTSDLPSTAEEVVGEQNDAVDDLQSDGSSEIPADYLEDILAQDVSGDDDVAKELMDLTNEVLAEEPMEAAPAIEANQELMGATPDDDVAEELLDAAPADDTVEEPMEVAAADDSVEGSLEALLEDDLAEEPRETASADDLRQVSADAEREDGLVEALEDVVPEDGLVDTPAEAEVPQDQVLDWSDIASEIDQQLADDAKLEKEAEGDPAALNDFFVDSQPLVDTPGVPETKQELEEPAETMAPAIDIPVSAVVAGGALAAGLSGKGDGEKEVAPDKIDRQSQDIAKEKCSQCGKEDSVGVPFIAEGGRLYCPDCIPAEKPAEEGSGDAVTAAMMDEGQGQDVKEDAPNQPRYSFTINGLLRESWAKTAGAKAAIWAGTGLMYLVLLLLAAAGALLLPEQQAGGPTVQWVASSFLFQFVTNMASMIFSAGLIAIGINKVAGRDISWKMVFEGFSVAGKLAGAFILQMLLICIGFLLLVLPGIYLTVGYAMTIPLIIDRKMSPWQAMETSRKAIHNEWWKVFGLSLVMGLILLVSMIPLGIGLIWTWPMFVVLGGVLYRSLFGIERQMD